MYEVDQYTVSLLHFEDGLKDECGKVWSVNNGTPSFSSIKKIGNSSLYLNGSQYISTNSNDFIFGVDDFTIDWWMKADSTAGFQRIVTSITGFITPSSFIFRFNNDGNFIVYIGENAKGVPFSSTEWNHVAVVRKNGTVYCFINGNLAIQLENANANLTSQSLYIGGFYTATGGEWFKGYIDEFRISKIARWTSEFDPNPTLGKALLVVTMSDEIQKEYELTKTQINDFITWYNNRYTGTGLPYYTFNKDFNLGPFQSRKDYLVFDKIQNFEVMEYTK